MSEPSFASLNPALLARKGGAKPAMRPQVGPAIAAEPDLEDLGWNDMGVEPSRDGGKSGDVVPIAKAAPKKASKEAAKEAGSPARSQQEEIAERIASEPAKAQSGKPRQSAFAQGRRAAFTLRLDEDRHLKLRLAATIKGVSAQALVTEALDAQLSEIDDLEALAAKIKRS